MTHFTENQGPSHPDTPSWIGLHIQNGPSNGWAHPILTDAEHPLVTAGWKCHICGEGFTAGQVGIVTPFVGGRKRWVAYHRDPCFLDCLGIERA